MKASAVRFVVLLCPPAVEVVLLCPHDVDVVVVVVVVVVGVVDVLPLSSCLC